MPNKMLASQYLIAPVDSIGLELQLSGDWVIGNSLPNFNQMLGELQQELKHGRLTITSSGLGAWDSRLVAYILRIKDKLENEQILIDTSLLPPGIQSLLHLAAAVPEREELSKTVQNRSFLQKLGEKAIITLEDVQVALEFLGEISLSFGRFMRGKAAFQAQDFWLVVEQCGPAALPIVTLISVLMGLILAFVGAIQLRTFGADIYVADLVALGMVREMGAMMTAIIMAGRTGAAFAAQLGTMQVNEEIDAFKTMGIAAMDFLVLPRMLALILMMPLLTLYADFMGILGGMIVGLGMLDLTYMEYFQQTKKAITILDCSTGLIKSMVFGVLVAITGCLSGMQCGRSSLAVGNATTQAVVNCIVSIVIADAIFTIIFNSLGV